MKTNNTSSQKKVLDISRKKKHAFTFIEVLLAIAISAAVTLVAIWNFDGLIESFKSRNTKTVLRDAIGEARFLAVRYNTLVRMHFEEESKKLIISFDESVARQFLANEEQKTPVWHYTFDEKFVKIRFLPQPTHRGLTLTESKLDINSMTPSMTIIFSPDRSVTPFIAEITSGSDVTLLTFDPLSQSILSEKDL